MLLHEIPETIIIKIAKEEIKKKKGGLMDSQSLFVSFLRQPSTLAELEAGRQVFGRQEVQPFLAQLRQMHSTEEKDAALHDLVALLPQLDSFHAGMLALLCGMLVEGGGRSLFLSIPSWN